MCQFFDNPNPMKKGRCYYCSAEFDPDPDSGGGDFFCNSKCAAKCLAQKLIESAGGPAARPIPETNVPDTDGSSTKIRTVY